MATGSVGGAVARWLRRPPWWVVPVLALLALAVRWDDVVALGHKGRDLQQDVIAAQRLVDGDDLYAEFTDPEVAALGLEGPGVSANAHPPTAAVLAAPAAALPFPTAAVAWSAASLVALVAAVWLAARQVGRPAWTWVAPALAWWFPVALHVRFGQWSAFLLLAAVVAWKGIEEDRPALAGAALALGGAIKVVPLALAVVPLRRRQWPTLAWTAGLAASAGALALVLAPGSVGGFLTRSRSTVDVYGGSFGNGSLLGWWTRALEGSGWIRPVVDAPGLVWPLWAVSAVATVGAVGWVVWRCDDVGIQLGAVTVGLLLVSPVTWRHADVLLVLPAIAVLGRGVRRRALALALLGSAAALSLVDHWAFARAHRAEAALDPLAWPNLLRAPGTLVLVAVLAACVACTGPATAGTAEGGGAEGGGADVTDRGPGSRSARGATTDGSG